MADDDGSTGVIEHKFARAPVHRDFEFFHTGIQSHRLLIQECKRCGERRTPPAPMCPSCQSLDWVEHEADGRGRVYSFTIHHRPPLPFFDCPHPVVLVDMAEGFRMVASFNVKQVSTLRIGLDVVSRFESLSSGAVIHYFSSASAS